jgi:REP element-mobilizing transposase RayT
MGSTYTSLWYHIVFGTKERRQLIHARWRATLHAYLGGTIRGLGGIAAGAGGVADYVHLLVGLRATHRLADVVREAKKASSVWAVEHHDRAFAWQEGYAAFSVGAHDRDRVRRYIARQELHHRDLAFPEELSALLRRSGVSYDPKYMR